ncbi:MAG: type II secretion system F family protein [Chloroflexi bacterium]|nr:type II secretion system F family protein [Chloroflexota bacterium]MBV9543229.1 type II secretion system F family protein [Chloroflexota bacterium]
MLLLQSLPFLTAATFLLVSAAIYLVIQPGGEGNAATRVVEYTRLGLIGSPGLAAETDSLVNRTVTPLIRRLLEIIARGTPQRVQKDTARALVMAGSNVSPTMFLGIRGLIMFGLPLVLGLYVLAAPERTPVQWGLLGMSIIWGRKLSSIWLRRRIKKRQKAIDRALPYALDLMVACLEGGLSLDATLAKVADQSRGPLSEEIRRTLQEMTLGRPGAEALRDLGNRTGAPDLKRLTENIVQAEQMGISITEAMRTLAAESRVRRRQRAEEMARKAPIKMVPVLIFCILPALAAVVMTPAVIIMMRVLHDSIN